VEIDSLPPVYLLKIPDADALNDRLLERFESLRDSPDTRRSHFFHGRYENLYIDQKRIPEILPLITAAEQAARQVLHRPGQLRCGFWFNQMGPGHRTSLHSHEEDDELLSAVYYVTAPNDSGDLMMEASPVSIRVRPSPGLMVLFPPDLPHAVDTNQSGQDRLSVAFNFGPA
jgi:hypothetical protein